MNDAVAEQLRHAAPRVLAALARRVTDFAAAEDAVQEALLVAARDWSPQALPDNPAGWLYRVAVRRLLDSQRADRARGRREAEAGELAAAQANVDCGEFEADQDDALLLFFLCCHPSLSPTSAIALTLRAVGGLTTAEVARALLVPEPTMAQRITRAKQTVAAAGARFGPIAAGERQSRLGHVQRVLYLMFNEGYAAAAGSALLRVDVAEQAIRLARELHAQLPNDGETAGLLALMLLHHARRDARCGPLGELVPLHEQDRSRWRRDEIAAGTALAEQSFGRSPPGFYRLQAAIAALHAEATTFAGTDWRQILALYAVLRDRDDGPMVKLGMIVAGAMVHGAAWGLQVLDQIDAEPRARDERRAGHRAVAVRAHLLEMAGRVAEAADAYRDAAATAANQAERDYLIARSLRLRHGPGAGAG
ncbi:MAG: DUF6596 domain-containing protein [Planctomycetota bacterium]